MGSKNKRTQGSTFIKIDEDGNLKEEKVPVILTAEKVLLDGNGDRVPLFNLEEGLKARKAIDEINDNLYTNRDPFTDSIQMVGNRILVRLYHLQKHTREGIPVGGRTHEVKTESEMRKKLEEMESKMQYQDRGVIIKISSDCTEAFRDKVHPGDVVDIDPHLFISGRCNRWLSKDNVFEKFDNYFIIPEHAVEWVIKK